MLNGYLCNGFRYYSIKYNFNGRLSYILTFCLNVVLFCCFL